MPTGLQNFEARVASLIQDQAASVPSADVDAAIFEAVNLRFSSDRPRQMVTDVDGNGTSDLDLPEGFEDGFSGIRKIEYPIGNVPASYLDNSDFDIYQAPDASHLRLLSSTPSVSDKVRVVWTARHTTETTPAPAFEAVSCYAASLVLAQMAARYIQTMDAQVPGDSVSYRTKADECLRVSKDLRTRYYNYVGTSDGSAAGGGASQGPAMAIGDLNNTMGPGVDRITHSKYSR